MATGGDLLEVTFSNPTVGSGIFFCKAAEDSEIDYGGIRNNDDASGVDGGGNMIVSMSRVRWMLPLVISWDMNTRGDMEKVVALAEALTPTEFTVSHINNIVLRGTGKIVGDIKGSSLNATIPITLSGGGKLAKL